MELSENEVLFMCLCATDNMEKFLTLAERQYIVKYELDGVRAQKDVRVPGLPDNYTLHNRDNICKSNAGYQCLQTLRDNSCVLLAFKP